MRHAPLLAIALLAAAGALASAPAAAQKIDLPIALGLLAARSALPQSGLSELYAVGELALDGGLSRIFTGWIYANSPGLNAIEHPVYDIWLVDCLPAPAAELAEEFAEESGPDHAGTFAEHPLPPPRPAP